MRLSRVPVFVRAGICFALLVAVFTLSGCGKSMGSLSGNVTYKGKALKGGTVGFTDASGFSRGTAIKEDGSYEITDLPTGTYKVTVETASLKPRADPNAYGGGSGGSKKSMGPSVNIPKGKGAPPKGQDMPEGYKGSNPAEQAAATASKFFVDIPLTYANKDSSGLTVTVNSGENPPYNIELK